MVAAHLFVDLLILMPLCSVSLLLLLRLFCHVFLSSHRLISLLSCLYIASTAPLLCSNVPSQLYPSVIFPCHCTALFPVSHIFFYHVTSLLSSSFITSSPLLLASCLSSIILPPHCPFFQVYLSPHRLSVLIARHHCLLALMSGFICDLIVPTAFVMFPYWHIVPVTLYRPISFNVSLSQHRLIII